MISGRIVGDFPGRVLPASARWPSRSGNSRQGELISERPYGVQARSRKDTDNGGTGPGGIRFHPAYGHKIFAGRETGSIQYKRPAVLLTSCNDRDRPRTDESIGIEVPEIGMQEVFRTYVRCPADRDIPAGSYLREGIVRGSGSLVKANRGLFDKKVG
jgi:hypothetical protein